MKLYVCYGHLKCSGRHERPDGTMDHCPHKVLHKHIKTSFGSWGDCLDKDLYFPTRNCCCKEITKEEYLL